MKIKINLLSIFIAMALVFSGCYVQEGQYKRINLNGTTLGEDDGHYNKAASKKTTVEYNATETFADTMPIYEITPRVISEEEVMELAAAFNIKGELDKSNPILYKYQLKQDEIVHIRVDDPGNRICFRFDKTFKEEMKQTDEELISQAKEIFNKLSIIDGKYECLGITKIGTVSGDDFEYIDDKRVSFGKLIDGTRTIGEECCYMLFNSDGLAYMELELYDYEVIGEMDMVPLETAKSKIKNPDALGTYEIEGKPKLTDTAEKLTVERVKLIYVNQYGDGCTILQPVYNFIGTATNGEECMEFQSKVIAIPDKYTYTE